MLPLVKVAHPLRSRPARRSRANRLRPFHALPPARPPSLRRRTASREPVSLQSAIPLRRSDAGPSVPLASRRKQPVERAPDAGQVAAGDARVELRGPGGSVAEECLNVPQVRAVFQQVGGEGMPQRVHGDVLLDPRRPAGASLDNDVLHAAFGQMPALARPGEQPAAGGPDGEMAAERVSHHGREHHVAVLAALALAHVDAPSPGADDLAAVSHDLSSRLRKTLAGKTPAEALNANSTG